MSMLITGVIDGPLSGGVPKAIELTVLSDIADLSVYGLGSPNNGNPSDGVEFTFPAVSAAAGDVIYVSYEEAGFTDFFGFAPDYTGGVASINGDDAIELFENGTLVDSFGQVGVDGTGEAWDYLDGWAYRNADVTGPSATFDPAQWTYSGTNALDGETTNAGAETPFPAGSFSAPPAGDGPFYAIAADDAARAEGDAGSTDFTFTVTRTGDASAAGSVDWAVSGDDVEGADFGGSLPSGTVDFAAGETEATVTVTVAGDEIMENDESFTVTLTNATSGSITTASAEGTIVNDDLETTLISTIQGNAATWGSAFGRSDATPLFGQSVSITAIVVGDFQNGDADTGRNLGGFYLQEEDADSDGDATTSEGIFIFEGSGDLMADVQVGDRVTVTGTATEFFGETQVNASAITVESMGNVLPTPADISFPIAGITTNTDGQLIADLEAYEGMSVTVPTEMTVADLFDYGRFGEIGLYADGRLETYTQSNDPAAEGFQAYVENAVRNTLVLDDGLTAQNPFDLAYPDGSYGVNDGLSSGDTVTDITGVVRFSRGSGGSGDENYRINPTEAPTFEDTNPRQETPPEVGGNLKVASFNVLNYFNGDGQGGGFPTPRGADTPEEFARQQEKLVAAITAIDADVIGLIEIENDGYGPDSAIQSLVDALNARAGAGTYALVDPGTDQLGSDAIAVGMLYKPAEVTLVGDTAVLDKTVDPRFDSDNMRPTLAQSFRDNDSGGVFTTVVNHLKSKGSPVEGTPGDEDAGDGAGNANATRTNAAEAIADWLATDPTGVDDHDVLLVGDLNSYAREDPIKALLEGGDDVLGTADDLTNLVEGDYSYGFPVDLATAGHVQSFGTLDYALASESLTSQVTGAEVWHLNSDEPAFIDYNTEFKPDNPEFYAPDAFRSSDHDPVIVGLDLAPETRTARLEFREGRGRDIAVYSEDGTTVDTERLHLLSKSIDVASAGITIDADDGTFLPEFVTTAGQGIGVFSLLGDLLDRKGATAVDGHETLTFSLEDTDALSDALDVTFEFAKVSGRGQVELEFFDDGTLVESATLDVVDGAVSYDLEGSASFDTVELSTTGHLSVAIDAVEFQRIEADDFAFA